MRKYRYDADKGEAVPVETDEERKERETREEVERKEAAWKREQAEREQRRVGSYL